MKKVLFMGLVAFGAIFSTNLVNAQAVEQGNIIIDPYYGFPNFGKKFADGFNLEGDAKVKGIGPCGIRAEYMLADKFGVGIDFIYNSFSITGTADSLRSDGTVFQSYDVKAAMNRFRVQARFNYHLLDSDQADAYFGFAAGTNIRKYSVKTDFPNYDDESVDGTLLPVSFRACFGARYYFTDNIGINGELGIGGPVLSIGLSVKL